jgi:hypothetical protein
VRDQRHLGGGERRRSHKESCWRRRLYAMQCEGNLGTGEKQTSQGESEKQASPGGVER